MTTQEEVQSKRRSDLSDPVEQLRRMFEIRYFDEDIVGLFSEGLVHGTTHTCQGQEALNVGLAAVLNSDDFVACTYRSHGFALALGLTPEAALGEIMGRTTGCIGGVGGSMHLSAPHLGLLPTFAIVGAGLPIAAGAALAFQTRGENRVAVAVFGDGAANIGAFHEALNLASVWKLPVIFVCDNNLYGEYSRIETTTSVIDIAQRADSYSMPSEIIDGMLIDEVVPALTRAVERARNGGGPTLIEAKTYRYAGHSRADLATYRPEGELESWLPRDPLIVRQSQLIDSGVLTTEQVDQISQEEQESIAKVIKFTRNAPFPQPEAIFQNIWTS
jgi:pyruvate dehydrogenase E1 component alpha subunit